MAEAVFGGTYSDAYDSLYGEKSYDSEVATVATAFSRFGSSHPASLLDLGCGTGSHALRFAERGTNVVGVDLSDSMLHLARQKAERLDADARCRVRFVRGDIGQVTLAETFDAAIMMFAVLGYQRSNASVIAALKNVRRHLKPGALFVFDVWYGPAVLTERPGDRVKIAQENDQQIIRTTSTTLNTFENTADVSFTLWRLKGERLVAHTQETHVMRYFFAPELELFLDVCGFSVVSLSAFPDLDAPLTDRTWNALAVARAV